MENEKKSGRDRPMFASIPQAEVPKGRDGKHKQIISQVIDAVDGLKNGSALKIALSELPDSKENIRSALSRATKQKNMDVATSSDENYLYVWKNGG